MHDFFTSTAGHNPFHQHATILVLHLRDSLPVTFPGRRSSVHEAVSILKNQRQSVKRQIWPNHCHFSSLILWAMSVTLEFFLLVFYMYINYHYCPIGRNTGLKETIDFIKLRHNFLCRFIIRNSFLGHLYAPEMLEWRSHTAFSKVQPCKDAPIRISVDGVAT